VKKCRKPEIITICGFSYSVAEFGCLKIKREQRDETVVFFRDNCHLQECALQITLEFLQN